MISEESSEGFYQSGGRFGLMVWVKGGYECRSDEWLGVLVLEVCIVPLGGFASWLIIVSGGRWGGSLLGVF